jgi:hypothetical protein
MKTVLAQGRKDLVANSVLFWVWGVCVGIDCLCFLTRLPYFLFVGNAASSVVSLGSLLGGMTIVIAALVTQALLAIVLFVRIVQADSLTDSSAFWRTRPIARYELLAEKALFAALLLAGGVLAAWATHSGSPRTVSGTAMLGTLGFVAGVFAFAAVTSDFSRFILALLALAWGAMIVAAILLALLKYLATSSGVAFASWPLAAPSFFTGEHAHLLISAFYLLAFVGIVVFQYLTLRTHVSRKLLFATFFIASVLQGNGGRIEFHSSRSSHVRGP